MYLTKLFIWNFGPIDLIDYDFPQKEDNTPKLVIFVGQNGSGKSIVLAHLSNAILTFHSSVFEESEIEKGKV